MQRNIQILISCLSVVLLAACSSFSNQNWPELIPEQASFVIIPEEDVNVQDIAAKPYFSYLDDLTPSSVQQIASLEPEVSSQLKLAALALLPSTSTDSHFLWIAESSSQSLDEWAPHFYQAFTQNNYDFKGHTIHKLFFNNTEVFAAQAGSWIILSEASLVVEQALRTYNKDLPAAELDDTSQPGSLIANTPSLDHWIEQFAAVGHRPSLLNKFSGTRPVTLNFDSKVDSLGNVQLSGAIALKESDRSAITDAISYENKPLTLDRHIASNAAAFAILRLPPVSVPEEPASGIVSPLDSLLLDDLDTYQQLAGAFDSEFAFQAFSKSGLMASGEFLFMRKLKDKGALQRQLNRLASDGLISRQDDTYQMNSEILAVLIGSELTRLRDFYLDFSGDVAVIAKRKGLAESVNSDRLRRRVIYYDETYSNARANFPDELSGLVWAATSNFNQFISPYLKPGSNSHGFLNRFDIASMQFTAGEQEVDVTINTYNEEGSSLPYEELWVLPLSNFELSGSPVLADLVGGSTDEVIFSTTDGRVMALAADGTIAMQTSTDGLAPVGGPVMYDWYGNGQQVILMGAGSRIFAWNQNGDLLPRFPIELDERISAPIKVVDVLRNGVPEIIVATENRKLHVLDGRGDDVRGWPQNTNSAITSAPVFERMNGIWSVWAFSENSLHSWRQDGTLREGFPQFVNTRLNDSPYITDNQILGSGADGFLYSFGEEPFFSDSAATVNSEDSIGVRSLYVANSELLSASVHDNVLLKDSANFIREDVLATQSANGSVFLYNKEGQLRFTQSLGQPSSSTLVPNIIDINSDLNMELIALAEFGRFYAWELLTDKRLYNLPTSSMKYPIIVDLNGDGQKELIAQTREGLRCWTINQEN